MKYCKICKTSAKETDTVCVKGHPLSVFGARPAGGSGGGTGSDGPRAGAATTSGRSAGAAPGGTAMFTLQGQVRRLEEAHERNVNYGRGLGLLSLLAVLAISFILYQVYARSVLDYAIIENIRIEQDSIVEQNISVIYDVVKPGKVAYDRRSGPRHTEMVDVVARTGERSFGWSWTSDPKTGIDFRVVYRGGWLQASEQRHFDVSRGSIGVEVVFLMDITSSMAPYIRELKRNCNEFAEKIRREGVDCRLGLIGFGDVEINEPMFSFAPTEDVEGFQGNVSKLDLTSGGDAPESSVEALEKALEMTFRPRSRVCFVLVTDADCHNRERIPLIARELEKEKIVTFVVSQPLLRPNYDPLCVNGGSFHNIRGAQFQDVLKDVAESITSQIRSE